MITLNAICLNWAIQQERMKELAVTTASDRKQILSLLLGNMQMHYTYSECQLPDIILIDKLKNEITLSSIIADKRKLVLKFSPQNCYPCIEFSMSCLEKFALSIPNIKERLLIIISDANYRVNDGYIYIFDRKTGKGIRKINRKGQGGEEYAFIVSAVLDEDNEEIFVNSSKKILVYDLYGNFKRSFNTVGGADYMDIFNYDKNNLICYDMTVYYRDGEEKDKEFYHSIISKKDGSVTRGISIPFKTVKAPFVRQGDVITATTVRALIPCQNNWLLVETSSDTVYSYRPDNNQLNPFIVKQSSGEPEVLITMGPVTDRYYFFKIIEKKFDFSKGRGFPATDLMYDKEEDAFYKPVIVNADYINKQEVNMTENVGNGDVATYQNLMADQLIEAYADNKLKNPLKEIAAKLNEESNPVVMLVKYRE